MEIEWRFVIAIVVVALALLIIFNLVGPYIGTDIHKNICLYLLNKYGGGILSKFIGC